MQFQPISVVLLLSLLTSISLPAGPVGGKPNPSCPCESGPDYHKLDFWIGKGEVYDNRDGTLNGTDVVEKIVGGCAIVENWQEADGSGKGKSLFYFQKAKNR